MLIILYDTECLTRVLAITGIGDSAISIKIMCLYPYRMLLDWSFCTLFIGCPEFNMYDISHHCHYVQLAATHQPSPDTVYLRLFKFHPQDVINHITVYYHAVLNSGTDEFVIVTYSIV